MMRHVDQDDDHYGHEHGDLVPADHFIDDYGDEPIYKCQNCASKNPGYEEKEASLLTAIAAVLSLLVFRLYAFLILPLVIESTKTIIKKCVKCDHVLDRQELLSMPSLTDNILSFKCGNCALVISRKYALVILAVLITIWFFIPSSQTITNPGGANLVNLRWEDFVEDCGRKVVLSNQVRAKRNFDVKYAKNIVTWTGVLQSRVPKDRVRDPFIGDVLLIKMNPSDSKEEYPDIQLVFSNTLAGTYSSLLTSIQPADEIEFKAVMRNMGDEFHYHDFEAISAKVTGKKVDLATIPMLNYTGTAAGMLRKSNEAANTITTDTDTTKTATDTDATKKTTDTDTTKTTKDTDATKKTTDTTTTTPAVENDKSSSSTSDATKTTTDTDATKKTTDTTTTTPAVEHDKSSDSTSDAKL